MRSGAGRQAEFGDDQTREPRQMRVGDPRVEAHRLRAGRACSATIASRISLASQRVATGRPAPTRRRTGSPGTGAGSRRHLREQGRQVAQRSETLAEAGRPVGHSSLPPGRISPDGSPAGKDSISWGIKVFDPVELCVLSGPAILRISVLLIVAGILAALVQSLLPSPAPAPVPAAAPPSVVQPAEPPPPPTDRAAPAAPAQDASVRDAPVRDIPAAPQETTAPSSPAQMPADALAFPSDPAAAPPAQEPVGEAEIDRAEDSAGPRALAVLDLNTASVADLNRLRGGTA